MSIGELIYNRRKELGLTLEDVGKFVGVGKSTVKKWESGFISNMRRDKIALLAKILEIEPTKLIDSDEPNKSENLELSAREESLITNYRQLNTGGKDKADEYVEDLIKTGKYSDDDDENVEIVTIAARKGGPDKTLKLKKRGNKSIFDAPDYR